MTKKKAIFVTVLFFVLLAAVLACLVKLGLKSLYLPLLGLLGLYGGIQTAFHFCLWLCQGQPLLPAMTPAPVPPRKREEEPVADEAWAGDYDKIVEELRKEL